MDEMAFQPDAFQNDAFQVGSPIPSGGIDNDAAIRRRRAREEQDERIARDDEDLNLLLS